MVESVKVDVVFEELPTLLGWCHSLLFGGIRSEIVHLAALTGILESLGISYRLKTTCTALISDLALAIEFCLEMKYMAKLGTVINLILPFEIIVHVIQLLIIVGLILDLYSGTLQVCVGPSCAVGDTLMLLMELESAY